MPIHSPEQNSEPAQKTTTIESKEGLTDPMSVKVDLSKRTKKRHRIQKLVMLASAIFIIAIIAAGSYAYAFTNSEIIEKDDQQGLFGQIYRIIDSDVEPLQGEAEDRINILLLGKGGADHPGGRLVDTIMLVSIKPSTNQVAMISLPRDLVIPYDPDETNDPRYYEYRKINYMMELGGIEFAKKTIKEVTGLDVNYHVLIDFAGFRDVIDTLGGVDVLVDNSFTDYRYPDYNYGYQTIEFKKGWDNFDGERALQYSRSRHGNNGEGSDFARASRQQKVLEGVRSELLSASTFLNPAKISGLLSDLGDRVSTNIEIWEMARFAQLAENINPDEVINEVVDQNEKGLLVSEISSQTGAYVLIPVAGLGDYSQIRSFSENIFDTTEVVQEDSVVAVQNATYVTGLAAKTAASLRSAGLNVGGVTNAKKKGLEFTIIYQIGDEDKPHTAETLEKELGVQIIRANPPTNDDDSPIRLANELDYSYIDNSVINDNTDFVVLLGSNTPKATSPKAPEADAASEDDEEKTTTEPNSTPDNNNGE